MAKQDRRVDSYIRRAPEFAQPVLRHIREVVHAACPEAQESIRWGFPWFSWNGPLCGMAAFKAHCTLGFWKGEQVTDVATGTSGAMGQFGRVTSVRDLPPKTVLRRLVQGAMALNAEGVPKSGRAPKPRPAIPVPPDLGRALATAAKAKATFAALAPSHRREYLEWITGAKRPETRARRIATSIEWLAAGKRHGWRYERR